MRQSSPTSRLRRVLSLALAPGLLLTPGLAASAAPAPDPLWDLSVPAAPPGSDSVQVWLTDLAAGRHLERLDDLTWQRGAGPAGSTAAVDTRRTYQTFDGYGASMTETSAWLLTGLDDDVRSDVMEALFSRESGIGLSAGRVPFGASDFAVNGSYSYDDVPRGETDEDLSGFTLGRDLDTVLPRLAEARDVNPSLVLTGSPWSPPGWMKTSDDMVGGTLRPEYEAVFAQYLARTLDAYAEAGVPLDHLTLQNEPLHSPGDYPGMHMEADQARAVIGHLAPLLDERADDVELLAYDHNWDNTAYAESHYADASVASAVAGTAWHCYGGAVTAQSLSHNAYPHAGARLTECSGGTWQGDGAFAQTMSSVIDAPRNWAQSVVLWNLALDARGGPTNGGCQTCRGVVTVQDDGSVTPELEYWALAHGSAFVEPGAVRVASSTEAVAGVRQVVFANPGGTTVMIAHNDSPDTRDLTVQVGGRHASVMLPPDAAATLRWDSRTSRAGSAQLGQVDLELGRGPAGTPGGELVQTLDAELVAALSQVHDGRRWWSYSVPGGAAVTPAGQATELGREAWTVTASSSAPGDDVAHLIDGDPATRWSSGSGQAPGQWVRLDLGAATSFDEIVLDSRGSDGDFARAYDVRVSDDGETWRPAARGPGRSALDSIVLAPTTARYVEIAATGWSGSWWSIHELRLLDHGAARAAHAGTAAAAPSVAAAPSAAAQLLASAGGPRSGLRVDADRLGDGTIVVGAYNGGTRPVTLPLVVAGTLVTYELPATAALTWGIGPRG